MTARPTSGIRRIDQVDGGVIAWLYGETDLDDVMLTLAKCVAYEQGYLDGWTETLFVEPGPRPRLDAALGDEEAWAAYCAALDEWRAGGRDRIVEDHPTGHVFDGAEIVVGWYRRMPWCPCPEEHDWHYEPAAGPGRGASLAVLVTWG